LLKLEAIAELVEPGDLEPGFVIADVRRLLERRT
jgi:hypothetical protein